MSFVRDMAEVITDDFETAGEEFQSDRSFMTFCVGLEYIGVNFKHKMGGQSWKTFLPGERGIVYYFIFYLALVKKVNLLL